MYDSNLDFSEWMFNYINRIETILQKILSSKNKLSLNKLDRAMEYSVLNGGKHIRAMLVYSSFIASVDINLNKIDKNIMSSIDIAAAAIELIHSYSLVHDDLPIMDNDSLRRGLPTTHIVFGEATALLVGDALQSLAFEILADMPISDNIKIQSIRSLAKSAGKSGMAGGQAIDLESIGCILSHDEINLMHSMKTGAIFRSSIELGCIISGASLDFTMKMMQFSKNLGLSFQIVDDILDITSTSSILGKTAGKDHINNKPTYVSLFGIEKSKNILKDLKEESFILLKEIGVSTKRLMDLFDFIITRNC